MSQSPVLLIHGGASNKTEFPQETETIASLDRIVLDAAQILTDGGSALDAVARAVEGLEADPLFNAGYGAKLQSDGVPRLSASAMDGYHRRFGAVMNVQDLCHPSHLALRLLECDDRVLDAAGAHDFARELGVARKSPMTDARFEEWEQKRKTTPYGTVGAVAFDIHGHLAAMTSTGGKGDERPGRVSDSATPAGNYADRFAAVSCTGIGEHILESSVGPRLGARVEAGANIDEASDAMMAELRLENRELGYIAIDHTGRCTARLTTECMAHRIWRDVIIDGWPARG